jgi:hypothetical protein
MSNKKLNGFFAYVLLAVVLSACESRLKSGVVVDKWYEEGETETYVEYDIIFKLPMTETRRDDEDYVLIVKGFNGKDTVQQRFEITQTYFQNTKVGDSVAFQ